MASEKFIETAIVGFLEARGAIVIKVHGNEIQSSTPDLIVSYPNPDPDKPSLYIAIEVKNESGKLRKGQIVRLRKYLQQGTCAFSARGVARVRSICDNIDAGRPWGDGTKDYIG